MANVVSLQLFFIFFFFIKFGVCFNHLNVSCFKIERKALLDFKASLDDPSGRLSSWIGQDFCRWKGVRCSSKTNRVIGLELRNSMMWIDHNLEWNDMSALWGMISPSLVDLKYLSYFDISGNNFYDEKIPDFFGSFKCLRYLNLSDSSFNSFSGSIPQSFRNLSNLEYLDLHSYNYSTSLSLESDLRWLNSLSSLKHLNLGSVNLSRADSYWLQSINTSPSLLELHLSNCQLQKISPSLPYVNFSSLLVLDISSNRINSTIPQWLFNLSSLTQLYLHDNLLQGVIPDAFSQLSALKILDLSSNYNIEGKLSSNLGKFFHLKKLDLSDNMITGSIPESIRNLSTLEYLDLSDNQMRGNITTNLGKLSSLEYLRLDGNSWEGIITEDHLVNLSNLQALEIGVPDSLNITLVFNISSDWVPPFKLIDITIYSCRLDEFPKWLKDQTEVKAVVLNKAMMSGTIPEWFWKLNLQLHWFDVAHNHLMGKVPNSLRFLGRDRVCKDLVFNQNP